MTLVVNMYGGPGTGKSTTAAALFAELKQAGVNAELVTEYAKDRVWDDHVKCLEDQLYVLGKQYHRFHRLLGKVDVIVTDAPILLSAFYNSHRGTQNKFPSFTPLVREVYASMNNYDVFLRRVKAYNPSGRLQTEAGAREIDVELKEMLDKFGVTYCEVTADNEVAGILSKHILKQLEYKIGVDEATGIDFSATVNVPELSREEILERGKARPFNKFVSFPVNLDGCPSLEALGGREL